MPMQNVKITCNIGCSGTCGALYWVHENKTTAVREGCRPHEPAQVSTAPTQRHDAAPQDQYTLLHGLWQDWDFDGVAFVADYLSTV